jgi:Zn-dependent alcohol dehydrogenase
VTVEVELSDEHLSLLGCGVTTGVGAVLNLAEVAAVPTTSSRPPGRRRRWQGRWR